MIYEAIAMVFKYKVVANIIIFTCCNKFDAIKLVRQFSDHDMLATVSCDPAVFEGHNHRSQGVLYIPRSYKELDQVSVENFSNWYKWVIVSEYIPDVLHRVRYDADIILVEPTEVKGSAKDLEIPLEDVYIHPYYGASVNSWAYWSSNIGLRVIYDRERIQRRFNLGHYPLRIATPLGLYSNDTYDGSFVDYLKDVSMPERDSGVRCGYTASSIIIEKLNATEVIIPTMLWSTEVNNSSMLLKLRYGTADLGGGILRMMHSRFEKLDYAMTIWPFRSPNYVKAAIYCIVPIKFMSNELRNTALERHGDGFRSIKSVGFTYLAERESSSNMFVAPFTAAVWWCCLALFAVLSVAQRVTAKSLLEKDGAFIAVLATYLQQDASAVPDGISGRWTFLVLSISAMLIHAYYTSAIVSALMSTGRSGPDSLRSLGDSRYAIASEDYDYMRYLMFDVPTNWDDLEYLKRKKITGKFYQDIRDGVKMIQGGQTAYHTEYNQLYPHLNSFTDDQLCKLQYVDTIPETPTWITTNKRGQWTEIFKSSGAWLHETGLAKQLVSRLRIQPPPCLAALLAERVNIYDITPLLVIILVVVGLSIIILGMEMLLAKMKA